MKPITMFLILFLFLSACSPASVASSQEVLPKATEAAVQTATAAPTVTPSPVPTATPLPDIGRPYTGYWLKLVKVINDSGSQVMTLYYQDGYELAVIATFCVRAGDNNTPNGFYFIAVDRPTTYPTAHGGFQDTFFSHNFAWKLSFRNWYLHAAPWNTKGVNGCPTAGSGGCVNMRTDDFNLLLKGGDYENPITGEKTVIPDVTVGTPFVIVDTDDACKYLGNCMNKMACKSGQECFRTYTCSYCKTNAVSKWNTLVALAPFLSTLDTPYP